MTEPWQWRIVTHWAAAPPQTIRVRDYFAANDLVQALFDAEGLIGVEILGGNQY